MQDAKPKSILSRVTYYVGYPLQSIGWVLLIMAKSFGALSVVAGMRGGNILFLGFAFIVIPLCCLIFALLAVPGSLLTRIGRRLSTKRAEELLLQDTRNPVLYLRSFVDDSVAAKAVPVGEQVEIIFEPLLQLYTAATEEEVLISELNRIGPCIAVGVPNERLPPTGAARMYYESDKWEKGVQDWMKRSELVVMRAGITDGLMLELKMAVEYVDSRKLIILFSEDEFSMFKESADEILHKKLPPVAGEPLFGSSLFGVIRFQPDWSPKILILSDVGETLKDALEAISRRYSNFRVI